MHSGDNECDCGQKDGDTYIYDSYEGPWCFCADPETGENTTQYCYPPKSIPEQINLQLAGSGLIVVGFVTYEDTQAADPPMAVFYSLIAALSLVCVLALSRRHATAHRLEMA